MAPYSFETALPSIPLSNPNDALLLDSSALTEQQADLATMKLARRKKLQVGFGEQLCLISTNLALFEPNKAVSQTKGE